MPIQNREYKHDQPDGSTIENKTGESGFIKERNFIAGKRKITLKTLQGSDKDVEGGSNPGSLPALDLRNRSDGGDGPLRRGDSRSDLVKHLQQMLSALKYDLGDTGPDNDGIDSDFGAKTQVAVEEYQKSHKDWEGKQLLKDGRVGPRTSDALNRTLVGFWYDKYETPTELTDTLKLVTVTDKVAVEKGVEL
jgi:peptidoglycan hydrolase-like protein with peptidoglycan-binding domain